MTIRSLPGLVEVTATDWNVPDYWVYAPAPFCLRRLLHLPLRQQASGPFVFPAHPADNASLTDSTSEIRFPRDEVETSTLFPVLSDCLTCAGPLVAFARKPAERDRRPRKLLIQQQKNRREFLFVDLSV